jgi:ribosomal-protein-serine acetyltransferase
MNNIYKLTVGLGAYGLYRNKSKSCIPLPSTKSNIVAINHLSDHISLCKINLDNRFPIKVSEGFYIDRLQSQDALELSKLVDKNRLYLRKTLPWLDYSKSTEDSKNFISQANDNFVKDSLILGIKEDNSRLIGTISFNTIDWIKKEAEIGYWIDEEMQGKGIVTKSCSQLVDLGLNDLKLKKILISCSTINIKSQSVPKGLGFYKEGIVKNKEFLYDHHVDHVLFSKVKEGESMLDVSV